MSNKIEELIKASVFLALELNWNWWSITCMTKNTIVAKLKRTHGNFTILELKMFNKVFHRHILIHIYAQCTLLIFTVIFFINENEFIFHFSSVQLIQFISKAIQDINHIYQSAHTHMFSIYNLSEFELW